MNQGAFIDASWGKPGKTVDPFAHIACLKLAHPSLH